MATEIDDIAEEAKRAAQNDQFMRDRLPPQPTGSQAADAMRTASPDYSEAKARLSGGVNVEPLRVPPRSVPLSQPSSISQAAEAALGSKADWADFGSRVASKAAPVANAASKVIGGAVDTAAKIVKPLAAPLGAFNAVQGAREGDMGKAALGAGDAIAGASLYTPAAPAGAAYLAGRGVYEGAQMLPDRFKDNIGASVNSAVRLVGKAVGQDWGVDDTNMVQAKQAQERADAANKARAAVGLPDKPATQPGQTTKNGSQDVSTLATRPTEQPAPAKPDRIADVARTSTKTPKAAPKADKAAKAAPDAAANPFDSAVQIIRPGGQVSYAVQGDGMMHEVDGGTYSSYKAALQKNPALASRMSINERGPTIDGVHVPGNVLLAGQQDKYISNFNKGLVDTASPYQAAINAELAKVNAQNTGSANVAGIQAAANRYGHDKTAETEAAKLKNNVIFSDDVVQDEMGNNKVVRRAYKPDGTPITSPTPRIDSSKAAKDARAAVATGRLTKEQANDRLRANGLPTID